MKRATSKEIKENMDLFLELVELNSLQEDIQLLRMTYFNLWANLCLATMPKQEKEELPFMQKIMIRMVKEFIEQAEKCKDLK